MTDLEKTLTDGSNLDIRPEVEEQVLRETLGRAKVLGEVSKGLARLSVEYAGGVSPILFGQATLPPITNSMSIISVLLLFPF